MRQRGYRNPAPIKVPDSLLAAGFVQVPVLLLRLPDLGLGAKLMYACLLWYHHRLGYWPGRQAVAHEFGIGERSVVRYLRELEDYQIVRIERNEQGHIQWIELAPPEEWGGRNVRHPDGDNLTPSGCHDDTLRVPNKQTEGEGWHARPYDSREINKETDTSHKQTSSRTEQTETPQLSPRLHMLVGIARGLMEQGRSLEAVQQVLAGYGANEEEIHRVMETVQALQQSDVSE